MSTIVDQQPSHVTFGADTCSLQPAMNPYMWSISFAAVLSQTLLLPLWVACHAGCLPDMGLTTPDFSSCAHILISSYTFLALQPSDCPGDNHCDKRHRTLKKLLRLLLHSAYFQGEPARLEGALKFIKVFAPGGSKVNP